MQRLQCLARILFVIAFATRAASAEPLPESSVPEALRPWIAWVLHDHEAERCPLMSESPVCAWPARLSLEVDDRGARFRQEWQVFADGYVPLPGDARRTPEGVTVDEKPAPSIVHEGRPAVWLARGVHRTAGAFVWDSLPGLLPLPSEIGLLALRVRGEDVPFPRRDEGGRLWLAGGPGAGPGEDRLALDVQRLARDEVPFELISRFELDVAGRSREVRVGPALLEGFVPLSLDAPLPVRLDPDGFLVVQARPGRFVLTLRARHDGPVDALALPAPSATQLEQQEDVLGAPPPTYVDDAETWAFEARPELRLVSVEGPPALDPTQTLLPAPWRAFPTYLMQAGATLTLVEKRRGDADPAPDRLSLARTIWLDFDGGGWTVHDRVSGPLSRSWRLEMGPETTLGRVAVAGEDQLVTKLPGAESTGVELRQGLLELEADSRVEGRRGRIPAVGWRHDFVEVAATAKLPPGWRLLHAAGADEATPTWITRWSLLDLFLVLVISIAVARLFGWPMGVLALAAVGLSWTEPGAPRWSWLALLACDALLRVLEVGRLRRAFVLARLAAIVALVLVAVPFLVGQARQALHPGLERPHAGPGILIGALSKQEVPGEAELDMAGFEEDLQARRRLAESPAAAAESGPMPRAEAPAPPRIERFEPDPDARITTGPGLPRWEWELVSLVWRGPVEQGQELDLWLLSPRESFVLAWLRIGLLAALAALILRGMGTRLPPARATAAALLAAAAFLTPIHDARADLPSRELLDELREKLLARPDCTPACVASSRARVEITGDVLRVRMQIDAASESAAPLPGGASTWLPEQALLDGAPAPALRRDDAGALWIALAPGRHEVELTGRLPSRDAVELPLPLRPARVEVSAEGWTVTGIGPDGAPDAALQLVRERKRGGAASALEPSMLPPFVRVERTLRLGLRLEVETQVVRLSPTGAPITLSVPLLAGESVTSEGLRVVDGRVEVALAPQAQRISWQGVLTVEDARQPIVLRAPRGVSWTESWTVEASPLWHLEVEGIPPVHPGDEPRPGELRARSFRPWPGEEVKLVLVRPSGIEGATLTIDSSEMTIRPGERSRDVDLAIELRSSRGGQHTVLLPEGAELQQVTVGGVAQPVRADGRKVVLPIAPGAQPVFLSWREPVPILARLATSDVDAGAPSVNATTRIRMPEDRWTLLVRGPLMGPAVLFWSTLAVVALLAIGLARAPFSPLRTHQWLLLGVGLTQAPIWAAGIVAAWLLALGWRRARGEELASWPFRLVQVALVLATAAALACLFSAIEQGLLGLPEMQIRGNGSSANELVWYQDRAAGELPRPWVLSVPLFVYRIVMLAWALWIATALLRWLRFGWEAFRTGGVWRPFRP